MQKQLKKNSERYKGKYSGVIPPIIIPLRKGQALDYDGLNRLIEYVIERGVSGIFVGGTSGEAMMVGSDVWFEAVKFTIEIVNGRVPVFCGVIDSSTARVLENIKKIEQVGGEIFVSTPAFYLVNTCQDEIIRHYETIAASTDKSIVVYNIPLTTHVNILPETIRILADIPNIVAYKDSGNDWEQFQRNIYLLEDKPVSLFDGAEELCASSLVFGAQGLVPGLSNFFPSVFVNMYKASLTGNIKEVYELQKKVWEIRKALTIGKSWMSAMKYIGSKLKFGENIAALPVQPLTRKEEQCIDTIINKYL